MNKENVVKIGRFRPSNKENVVKIWRFYLPERNL